MTTTILVVDDDAAIRECLSDLLGTEGYRVLVACDGSEAFAVMDREPSPPQLALVARYAVEERSAGEMA